MVADPIFTVMGIAAAPGAAADDAPTWQIVALPCGIQRAGATQFASEVQLATHWPAAQAAPVGQSAS